MARLIITRGLPASGKSTWANHFATRSENYDTTRIVTMDDIRVAVDARFGDGDESVVQSIRDFTIREYLKKGYTVISADTNLSPKTFTRVRNIAYALGVDADVQDFTDVPLETCLARNKERWARRDCKVPDQAIVKMHETYLANIETP